MFWIALVAEIVEYVKIKNDLAIAEQNNDGNMISDCHDRLAIIDGYAIEGKAANILRGLRFSQDDVCIKKLAISQAVGRCEFSLLEF